MVCFSRSIEQRKQIKFYSCEANSLGGVSRILGNGNGSGKRERELPFAILLTIKPIALKSLSHCHVKDFKWQCIQC